MLSLFSEAYVQQHMGECVVYHNILYILCEYRNACVYVYVNSVCLFMWVIV